MVTENGAERSPVYRETIERFWILRLVIEVRYDSVAVRLGPFQRSFRHISFREVDDVRVATYSSLTYGGWHWGLRRSFDGDTVYRLRGNRGVELVLTDETRIFIGTQQPADLESAITRMMRSEFAVE
ncbi:hypothetical protein D8Y22_10520 [Salinadaptatus halalkaliphilus]|uniref:Bacterial Pleckstrin homology domain-containing protein n=1 Tax=Salinadaptatus halalkaliphilus TaxID=2419781 RepID=A0A4S3TNS0_9EURY|nr:hypothetical protein [Salinadaptatus halalkaliphilus]THE64873.1 hypothetical protein D8Y22_10520 [Salinadaptatus halalkaliphilus]